jgi:multidrug transporter EmrE-like cation transporter
MQTHTLTNKIQEFLTVRSPATPFLVVDLNVIAQQYRTTIATRVSASMGITYVLILGLETLLAILFSVLLLKEEGYSAVKLAGIFLVVVGVAVLRSKTV